MSAIPSPTSASPLDSKSVLRGQSGWDEARRAWQLHVDQRPAAVVYPESAQDVVDAVLSARERGQRVAAQGTGHNAAPLGPLHDTLLLKTERMRRVTIDARARIARAEAGALSLEVVHAAAAHGLATRAGSSPGRFLRFPPIPEVPESVRGRSFVIVDAYHSGDPAQADELLAPLRALGPVNDTIRIVSMPELSHVHMDAERPVPGVGDGLMLAELPPEALDTFVDVAGTEAGRQLAVIELRHLEGELSRARPGHGALASIPATYTLIAGGFAPVPELVSAMLEHAEAVMRALAPWVAPCMHLNFADTRREPATFWDAQAYRRLRRVKSAVDPGDLIRSNHPIPLDR